MWPSSTFRASVHNQCMHTTVHIKMKRAASIRIIKSNRHMVSGRLHVGLHSISGAKSNGRIVAADFSGLTESYWQTVRTAGLLGGSFRWRAARVLAAWEAGYIAYLRELQAVIAGICRENSRGENRMLAAVRKELALLTSAPAPVVSGTGPRLSADRHKVAPQAFQSALSRAMRSEMMSERLQRQPLRSKSPTRSKKLRRRRKAVKEGRWSPEADRLMIISSQPPVEVRPAILSVFLPCMFWNLGCSNVCTCRHVCQSVLL
jgi:hypothetical protein